MRVWRGREGDVPGSGGKRMARSARKISAEHISAAVFLYVILKRSSFELLKSFGFGGGKLLGEIRRVGC